MLTARPTRSVPTAIAAAIVLALIAAVGPGAAPAPAKTFQVNSTADLPDTKPGDGICRRQGVNRFTIKASQSARSLSQAPRTTKQTPPADPRQINRLTAQPAPCSLRAAIEESNARSGRDVIKVPAGTYRLTHTRGSLTVTDSAGIEGEDGAVIDAVGRSMIALRIGDGAKKPTVNASRLTITGADEGGVRVNNGAYLSLHLGVIRDNEAISAGAGLLNASGSVLLTSTMVRDNEVLARGGGIGATASAVTEIVDSTVSGNLANQGGGINSSGKLRVTNSAVSGNRATFSGGGITSGGLTYISGSTITANEANKDNAYSTTGERVGGGVLSLAGGTVWMWNTILAGNTDHNEDRTTIPRGRDCFGTIRSERRNLIGADDSCTIDDPIWDGAPFDQVGTSSSPINPRLGSLADNGGPTKTHALLYDSPAIDEASGAAPGSDTFACRTKDQRGLARPVDGDGDGNARCDVGAYERQ